MPQIDFTPYHYLIIDSSFFVTPLDDELCKELSKYCNPSKMPFLCASSTFHSEVRQYLKLLANHPTQLAVYEENLRKLRSHSIKLFINSYSRYSNPDQTPRHDTWNLINTLFEDNRNVQPNILLLTGNELLLRRIVLSDLPVNIFDLKNRKLFSPVQLAAKKPEYELDSEENDLITMRIQTKFKGGDALTLFNADGDPVELFHVDTSCYIESTEGSFFIAKDHPDVFAKVYGKDCSTPYSEKIARNIVNMKRFHDSGYFPWAVLPETLLYDGEGTLVGYMMRRLGEHYAPLQNDSRYNISTDCDDHLDKPYRETIETCLMLLREIAYMNNYDILPVDFGKGNFCEDGTDPYIYMLDTCSFCFDRFNSRKCDPGIQNVKFGNPHQALTSKLALVDLYLEYIHLFVLSLMILGSDFDYSSETDSMCFLAPGTHNNQLFNILVPQNLQYLYTKLFSASQQPGAPFSVEVLMEEMEYALEVVTAEDPTYNSLVESNGHCGSIYPSRLHDVLPCVYQRIILVPLAQKAPPVERPRPKYLQRKAPPAIHPSSTRNKVELHPSRLGRASIDPLPSAYKGSDTSHKGLFIFLGVILVIALWIGMDMVQFSIDNLGFRFPLYWEAQMTALQTFWQDLFAETSAWFQSLIGLFSH